MLIDLRKMSSNLKELFKKDLVDIEEFIETIEIELDEKNSEIEEKERTIRELEARISYPNLFKEDRYEDEIL